MDTSGPHTVFIPSIDEFLGDDDETDHLAWSIPAAILAQGPPPALRLKQPFHERPTLALIKYEPPGMNVWKSLVRWTKPLEATNMNSREHMEKEGRSMDIDVDMDDVDVMDIDC
jgi:hypothetical protein